MRWLVELIFPRRLHRLAYFLRGAALNVVTGFLYANSTTFGPRYWWPLVIVLIIYGLFFIILPRIRDAGMSGWWLLGTVIPVADIVLGIILLFRAPALLARPCPNEGAPPNGGPEASFDNPIATEAERCS
jgi:uncharacterized membrane protein YhaH (DUF805 family)